jgi:hypothetical protein
LTSILIALVALAMLTTVRKLLRQGTSKMGERTTHAFNLPAWVTCPGASDLCHRLCYALQGNFRWETTKRSLARNLRATQELDFINRIIGQIWSERLYLVRFHASGDFFAAWYVRKWIEIVQLCPDCTFWGYTRSWRAPDADLVAALQELALQPNVYLLLSGDKETGKPPRWKTSHRLRTKIAWLLEDRDEKRPRLGKRDVWFLAKKKDRKKKQVRIGLTLVCPEENGTRAGKDLTCDRCGYCFNDHS